MTATSTVPAAAPAEQSENRAAGYTIDVDTGGTFTDVYVTGQGRTTTAKADTTPHDLTLGVRAAIGRAAESLNMSETSLLRAADVVRLSTTVGTNTLITRSGPKLGALVGADLAPLIADLPAELPLAGEMIATIPAGATDDGPIVLAAVRQLLERGARVIVIVLGGRELAEHEVRVRELITASYPRHYLGAVPILASHQVTPLTDPRLRLQSAIINGYLHPVMSRFLYKAEDQLRAAGYRKPLLIANANGGTSRVAKTCALRTWGSGPAGGVAAAATMARELGLDAAVSIDVGGTSSDIAVIRDGEWSYEVQPTIDGVAVSMPTLTLHSAALGGGTIVHVDDRGLRLGPASAGAQPGPAAFGLGGADATVTDAACALGFFDAANFLGGHKALEPDAARTAIRERVAAPLEIEVEEAAWVILDAAAAVVATAVTQELAAAGVQASDAAVFATGGAGGLLAELIREQLGARVAYVFGVSPVFSAFGLSRLDLLHVYETNVIDQVALPDELSRLRSLALGDMHGEGVATDEVRFSFELEVAYGNGTVSAVELGHEPGLLAAVAEHGTAVRLVRVKASALARHGLLPEAGSEVAPPEGRRLVGWRDGTVETPVLPWERLRAGVRRVGPVIVESGQTTLVVGPSGSVTIGALGEALLVSQKEWP